MLPLDAAETATALVWMNERYLSAVARTRADVQRALVVETLHTIWARTLYGTS